MNGKVSESILFHDDQQPFPGCDRECRFRDERPAFLEIGNDRNCETGFGGGDAHPFPINSQAYCLGLVFPETMDFGILNTEPMIC